MKTRQRWLIVAAAAFLLSTTLIVLPQIIGAKHFTWLAADRGVSAASALNIGTGQNQQGNVTVGTSERNDNSIPFREMKQMPLRQREEGEANETPKLPNHHID